MRYSFAFAGMIGMFILGFIFGNSDILHIQDMMREDSAVPAPENTPVDLPAPEKRITVTSPLRENKELEITHGRWHPARETADTENYTEEQLEEMKRLRAIGYLEGSLEAPEKSGITRYEAGRTWDGCNLVVSGHHPGAVLMDMNGAILHEWHCTLDKAWPDFDYEAYAASQRSRTYWRRALLLENGDIAAIFEGIGIIRLDRDSNVIWSLLNGAHHDVHEAENGDLYVLTRRSHINPAINEKSPILEDYITVLSADGELIREISVLDALMNSTSAPIIGRLGQKGDILHTNTIELIERREWDRPVPWRAGDVLISIRNAGMVCTVDMENVRFRWAESDYWFRQHQPELTDIGNLIVFNNKQTADTSSVIEMDPVTREIVWNYQGDAENPFYTTTCGSNQRLPNGNTLITESDPGRAFEVTPEGAIVWEYINPYRAGENNDLIATLFDVIRLDPATTGKFSGS